MDETLHTVRAIAASLPQRHGRTDRPFANAANWPLAEDHEPPSSSSRTLTMSAMRSWKPRPSPRSHARSRPDGRPMEDIVPPRRRRSVAKFSKADSRLRSRAFARSLVPIRPGVLELKVAGVYVQCAQRPEWARPYRPRGLGPWPLLFLFRLEPGEHIGQRLLTVVE